MKKIMVLVAILASFGASAQFQGTAANPKGIVSDATVDTMKYKLAVVPTKLAFDVLVSKTSGTMAGTVRLYGSNWDSTGTWEPIADTLTLTNVAVNKKHWEISLPAYKNYMVLQSGGTTVKGFLRIKPTLVK